MIAHSFSGVKLYQHRDRSPNELASIDMEALTSEMNECSIIARPTISGPEA
jgi:hypothetical protein